MNKDTKQKDIGGGLIPLPKDERDFSRTAVFGAPMVSELPDHDFIVAPPLVIKDQRNTDLCTAYATTSVAEDQENVVLNPEYTFFKTKVAIMKDPHSWGADLRSAMKSGCKFGFLEQDLAPVADGQILQHPDAVNPDTWKESDYDMLAFEHRKSSFFAVDGPYDTFDNIRAALWQHRSYARTITLGVLWRPSWTGAKDGIIPDELTERDVQEGAYFGHAFKIYGQTYKNGELYLAAQLSNGPDIGENGIFYFSRKVANRDFGAFGMFMYEDMPRDVAEHHNYYAISVHDGFFKRMFKVFFKIIADIFIK